MSSDKPDQTAYTVGTIRTNLMEMAKQYVSGRNLEDTSSLRLVMDEYYDSLPEDSMAREHLKGEWDKLAQEYTGIKNVWREQYNAADELDRFDLISQGLTDRFNYECQRYIQMKINYYQFKTYWDL